MKGKSTNTERGGLRGEVMARSSATEMNTQLNKGGDASERASFVHLDSTACEGSVDDGAQTNVGRVGRTAASPKKRAVLLSVHSSFPQAAAAADARE